METSVEAPYRVLRRLRLHLRGLGLQGEGASAPRQVSLKGHLFEAGGFGLVLAVALAWALTGTDYRVQLAISIAMMVTLAYSWNVISGFTGYISFGQVAFFGFGAFVTAELLLHLDVPWYGAAAIAAAMSGLIALPVGALMLRLKGIYFALGMFALVYLLGLAVSGWRFTGGGAGLVVPGNLALVSVFLVMMVAAVAAFGLNLYMARSRFGLRAMMIRDDEEVAGSMGVATTRVKVVAFALSAVLPALAGGLIAYNRSFVDSASVFDPRLELETILVVLAGGIGTVWGPLIGAVVFEAIGELLWANYPDIQLALFGALITITLLFLPGGIVSLANRLGFLRRAIIRAPEELPDQAALEQRVARELGREACGGDGCGTLITFAGRGESRNTGGTDTSPASAVLLACRDLEVGFGGVKALDGVDLYVAQDETLCVIGANGAGKTTLFNAISGMIPSEAGDILFGGESVRGWPPHMLARSGLARTFQIPRPFESLTVWENVLAAALGGRHRRIADVQAAWVVRVLRLEDVWLSPVNVLSVGHRRLVELARALALQPKVILLDEVMAGLSDGELEQVRAVIRRLPAFGVGAVAGIEHVIRAIVDIADRIVVLDKGRVIAEGSPSAILAHPDVIRAYLGEEVVF